jgi:ATP-dependent RNA helicase DDX46/PRP5
MLEAPNDFDSALHDESKIVKPVSDATKQRRLEKLAAWKSNLELSIEVAPKKPTISFSLLSSKKPSEKATQSKLELLDYSAAEAQISQPADEPVGTESAADGSSMMDIEQTNHDLQNSGMQSSRMPNLSAHGIESSLEPEEPVSKAPLNDEDDEVDPFDAFMASIDDEVTQLKKESIEKAKRLEAKNTSLPAVNKSSANGTAETLVKESGTEEAVRLDGEVEEGAGEEEDDGLDDIQRLAKVSTKKQLETIDHSVVAYEPFRKDFYIEVPELEKMSEADVVELRRTLDGVRVRGKDCPKPIKTFAQSGLSGKMLEKLKKMKFEKPTPIQAQALPAIMKGRDVIGIAKTGSGKTLAFLLPLLRHILAQRDLNPGEGPIGLIMVPTRELATQIHNDIREFKSATGIVSCCIYGGADMSSQIADLKRGAHIVVCTPGRMIEMLAMNKGRVTNLKRVTYLVIDEADRMFDLGFEQQIVKIVNNVRPDRQTVMFSATFPRQVEAAARKILSNGPIEITVHGRSVVSDTITQIVEVLDHSAKFYRLMELISEWYSQGSILVFAESQKAVDMLFHNVIKSGYDALSFHAGRDQTDRDETIERFKEGELKILIATSGASRGLDVPGLKLVVNYDVPNHLEDYVHRVGRTGRAGAKGTAITFIAPDEDQYAPDILKAMRQSNCKDIPDALIQLADAFDQKQKQGLARKHGSGFVGKGYQFSEEEDKLRKAAMNSMKLHLGGDIAEDALLASNAANPSGQDEADIDDDDDDDNGFITEQDLADLTPAEKVALLSRPGSSALGVGSVGHPSASALMEALVPEEELSKMTAQQRAAAEKFNELLIAKAQQAPSFGSAHMMSSQLGTTHLGRNMSSIRPKSPEQHYDDEIEINDFPQQVRRKITSKDTFTDLVELTGVAITPKGMYVAPGKPVPPGERKLYLSIEGPSQEAITQARNGIKQVLESSMANLALRGDRPSGRYTVD